MGRDVLRYDPERVVELGRQVRAAATDLERLTTPDPAASSAMRSVRLARTHLEHDWMPLVARVIGSDAMLGWSSSPPDAPGGPDDASAWAGLLVILTPATGVALGRELAARARAVIDGEADEEALTTLAVVLRAAVHDHGAIDTFVVGLGGGGVVRLLTALGEREDHPDEAIAVAGALRRRVIEAERRGALPATFADDIVATCVAELGHGRNGAVALSYLLQGPTPRTELVVAVTGALVERELARRPEGQLDGSGLWAPSTGFGVPTSVLSAVIAVDPRDHLELQPGGDPMLAALDLLVVDGAAGRAVFTDDRVARYLFGERDHWVDRMRRTAQAAATAAAGADVLASTPGRSRRDATQVASAFVNHTGSRGHAEMLGFYDIEPVRAATARILAVHLSSVSRAILSPAEVDPPAGTVVELADDLLGDGVLVTSALFDEASLDIAIDLAIGSESGFAGLRAALDVQQRADAAAGAQRLVGGDIREPDAFIDEALGDAARVEAEIIAHVGRRAEAMGREQDELIRFWTDSASAAADVVPVPYVDDVLAVAVDALGRSFVGAEAAAARAAEDDAEVAADRLLHTWYQELYRSGAVRPDDLPAGTVRGGTLIPWDEFRALPAADRATMINRMEETTGVVNLDGNALRDAVKTHQQPFYEELR